MNLTAHISLSIFIKKWRTNQKFCFTSRLLLDGLQCWLESDRR